MEILGKIFNSPARVKIMRLFLLNRAVAFQTKDIAKRSRTNPALTRKEMKLLASIGFIKKRGQDFIFNSSFKYAPEFESLLLKSDTLNKGEILNNFKKVGRVKLLIVSGILIKEKGGRVDLLVVGDKLNKAKIEEEIRRLEAEIGKELMYAFFETKEFVYRMNMYDKLVRDIFDFPHEVILETKELSTQTLKKS